MFSFEEIKELAELVGRDKLGSIEVKSANGDSVVIKGFAENTIQSVQNTSETPAPVLPAASSVSDVPVKEEIRSSGKEIKSPIVGTFYAASDPNSEPFVKVGDSIKKGDVVCIIEAMKIMNEITSEYSGTVKEILLKSGDAVEYDQPIMVIE